MKLFSSTFLFVVLSATLADSAAAEALSWTDAVKRTEQENPEILAAQENLRASEAKKTAAYGAFLPTVRASVGYETTERSGTATVPATTGTGWTAGLNGSLNLFSGFSDEAKIKQAEADRKSTEAALKSARAKISSDLKGAFEAVAYAREYSKLSLQILKRREENLRLVQLRYESGRENKGSVLLSEAYLEQARFDDLQARNAIRTSSVQLSKVLALDGDGTKAIEVVGNVPVSTPPVKEPDFTTLVALTPEYVQAVQQSASLNEARRIARASFFPTLDLSTSISKRGEEFFPNGADTRTFGVTLNIPLFAGGRDYNTYQASVAAASAANYTRDNSIREIKRKLEAAWADYNESVSKLKADESFRKAAIVRSDVARAKYNNGLLSFEDWDIIENDLITRQKTVLQTRRDRTTAEAAWEQAQGIGVW